jgi:DNA polymerase elongation subunit (family B)
MSQENRISEERINDFLNGKDPQDKIINIECDYKNPYASVIYMTEEGKRVRKEPFRPFLWAKEAGAKKLLVNKKTGIQNREFLAKKLADTGIRVKKLNIYTSDGRTTKRLQEGYRLMFTATKPMSYSDFLNFFRNAGVDIYDGSKNFLTVTPVEQYMMRSGKRLFKGFEDYDELLRLQFDLETEGLNPEYCRITEIGVRTNRDYENIISIQGDSKQEKDLNELNAIGELFRIISVIKPDVITGHNTENFDWEFIIKRCEVLHSSVAAISTQYFKEPLYKSKRKTVLKIGGEIEYFFKTNLWGYSITDSLHAVRRAQAIDSNMKKADLKYVTKYSKLNKPNRIYVPGDKINKVLSDNINQYALNNSDGQWYQINETNPLKDGYDITTGRNIVERYLKDDLYETDKVELRYNQPNFLLSKLLPTSFARVCTMGTAGIWKLIMMAWSFENDLGIPDFSDAKKFTGGLSRLLRVGFVGKVVKLDYNSLYPAINITWNTEPDHDISHVMLSLLTFILDKRELYKELKGSAKGKAKKLKKELETLDKSSEEYKELKKQITHWSNEEQANDKKQLPFKIFANSFFGGFGAPNLFPWGDIICAEKTTCVGRQSLRLMVKWFCDRKFDAIVMDTDGVNFSYANVDADYKYIGKGLNRNTVLGEEYVGVEAYVAEFNDLFMRVKMGLGIDEYAPATINFSRKNYADLLANGEVKYVGNTIKSKKMPIYIEKFMETGVKLLLNSKGKEFLDYYYDYVEKIYNYEIPLKDIASKGKVKKTIPDYKIDCHTLTKAGRPKNRQVWYELAIQNDYKPDIGETIYYINTGDGKKKNTYKDVEKKTTKGVDGAPDTYEIKINCIMLDPKTVDSEQDVFCTDELEYNAPKYIEQFNKRIKPLLVCFSPEIRSSILIKTPDKRQFFTEKSSELSSGQPNKPEDQDTYEQLMILEDKEIKYWISVNEIPPFIEECGFNWDEIIVDYEKRMEILKQEGIQIELNKFNDILTKLTKVNVEEFILEVKVPKEISAFLRLDGTSMKFISKEYNVVIGSAYDIVDIEFEDEEDEEMVEEAEVELVS